MEFFSVTVFALGGTIYVIQDTEQVMKRGIETGTCCDYCMISLLFAHISLISLFVHMLYDIIAM